MHFSEKYKVYWFTPQRTGTRSTKQLLRSLGFVTQDHHFTFDVNNKDYLFVSNVRNPYSRLVSLFHLNSHHLKNFDRDYKTWVFDTIKNARFIDSYQLHYHRNFKVIGRPFDKFIRQENLQGDLKSLSFIDLTVPEISEAFENHIVHNGYKREFENEIGEERKPWKEFYDEETAMKVFEEMKEQFELFGYRKDSWKNVTS